MEALYYSRLTGPQRVAGSVTTYTPLITAKLPAGSYLLIGKTVMGLIKPELSGFRLKLSTDTNELQPDTSTFFATNTATHHVQRAVTLTSSATVRLEGRCSAEWNALHTSLAVISLDGLTVKAVTG